MEKQIRQLKITVTALFLLLFLAVGSFSAVIKQSDQDLKNKNLKISALIDEVGELRNTDYQINKVLSVSGETYRKISGQLDGLRSDVLNNQYLASKAAINEKLAAIQRELIISSEEKEKKISRLAAKNNQLKTEARLAASIGKVETFNVLIVGENRKLTDTLMVAAINPANKSISLVSIPRDFYYNGRKINELYFRYGIEKTAEAVNQITGLRIDKYIIFDFIAFETFIDAVGGITVNVDKAIDDNAYPGPNFTYTRVIFNKGLQQMDGSTALKYARSRESTSDFDRTRRQQQIIGAAADQLRAMNLVDKLDLAMKIYAKISPLVESDINLFEALGYYGSYRDYTIKTAQQLSTSNLLDSTTNERGQYILLPKSGGYDEIKKYVSDLLN